MAVTANYETVMIISMKKGEEGIQAIVEKFKALIEKHATLKSVPPAGGSCHWPIFSVSPASWADMPTSGPCSSAV